MLVYRKEMTDSLRDRRTLMSMIVVPVIVIPLLMFGMGALSVKFVTKARQEAARVVLLGAERSPGLAEKLRSVKRFDFVDPPADLRRAIADREIRAAVEIPEGFDESVTAGAAPEVVVLYHEGEVKSEAAVGDVRKVTEEYRQGLVAERLEAEGLDTAVLTPFSLRPENVASKEQVTGRSLGGIVPYIIILMCLTGAMYPAIDLTAGEKERGTIETILVSSISRFDLVLGKFLTVLTASVATAVLSLASLAVTAMVIMPKLAEGNPTGEQLTQLISVSPLGLLGMIVLLIPLTVLFSSALLAIALFAKSFKEAQSYLQPLMIAVIVPAVMAMIPGFELDRVLALIPVVGTSLAGKELLAGNFQWDLLAIIFASTSLYALVALVFAVGQFNREEVLFRS
jgi:sodium transport system permease protein